MFIPAPTILTAPIVLFKEVTTLFEVKQLGQEIVPVIGSKLITPLADAAIVPLRFGTVKVLVVLASILLKSKLAFLPEAPNR